MKDINVSSAAVVISGLNNGNLKGRSGADRKISASLAKSINILVLVVCCCCCCCCLFVCLFVLCKMCGHQQSIAQLLSKW